MSKLSIDFAPPNLLVRLHRIRLVSALLLVLLVASVALLGLRSFKAYEARQQLQAKVDVQRNELEKMKRQFDRAKLAIKKSTLTSQQVEAINQAIFRLNMPWTSLFDAIQDATVNEVAVLKLEPDVMTQSMTISAESKSIESMFHFLEKLSRQELFRDVILSKHEIIELDPNKPVRFQLSLKWENRK